MLDAKDIHSPKDLNRYLCSKLIRPGVLGLTSLGVNDDPTTDSTVFVLPTTCDIKKITGFTMRAAYSLRGHIQIDENRFALLIAKDAHSREFCDMMCLIAILRLQARHTEQALKIQAPLEANNPVYRQGVINFTLEKIGLAIHANEKHGHLGAAQALRQLGINVRRDIGKNPNQAQDGFEYIIQYRPLDQVSLQKLTEAAKISNSLELNTKRQP